MTSSLRINIGDLSCSVWTPNSPKFLDPETKTCARVEAAAFQKILLCVMVQSGHAQRFCRVLRFRMRHFRRFHHVYLRVRHVRRFCHIIWLRVQHCRRFLHVLWLKGWHLRRWSHLERLRARQLRRNVPPAICLLRMLRHLWKEWDHILRNFIKKVHPLFLSYVPLHIQQTLINDCGNEDICGNAMADIQGRNLLILTYFALYYSLLTDVFLRILFFKKRAVLPILV